MVIAPANVAPWVPPCGSVQGKCEYICKYIIVKVAYNVC